MGLIADIADAVVQQLNSHEFSVAFTAERHYSPQYSLAELEELKVSVVPKGIEIAPHSRNSLLKTVHVDIGVQKKLDSTSNESLDTLLALVDEIASFLTGRNLDTDPKATWSKTENDPIYAQEHLVQFRQFTSVVTLSYKVCT